MKRILITLFAFASVTTAAYAKADSQQPTQPNCNLTAANAPTVRDIKLGMSLQQVLALFPVGSKRREMSDAIERARSATGSDAVFLVFDPASESNHDRFAGVASIVVGVYRGQVVDFSVSYIGPTWNSVNEWVEKLADTLGLPSGQGWTEGPTENPNRVLRCRGVEIEAGIQGGGGSIRVRNTEYNKNADDRRAAEERRRRDFKP